MHAIIYDCEFLTAPGAPQRFWCGPKDPDPVVAQLGLVRLDTTTGEITDQLRLHILPLDRHGQRIPLDPLFTRLTGITEDTLETEGLSLSDALTRTASFAGEDTLWSWGKDEFNLLAISCYVQGITPPLPATRFRNACDLLLAAGMPLADLHQTRSNTLPEYYDLTIPDARGHDALGDALMVAHVLRHLIAEGHLTATDFR
ncbi:MAG: exonuclease [Methylocystaceae bacterium]|nr:exonuclease [Methylocystaceae bacterium]